MQDRDMEKEIQDKGLTAPRITFDHIEELANQLTFETHVYAGTTTTVATAFLDGFSVATEISACASPENFDAELGAKYAIVKAKTAAKSKLWELEGYRLQRSLLEEGNV